MLYCPYNAIDAAERPLHRLRTRATGLLAAVLTIVVGVYFLVGREILTLFDLPDPIAPLWALVLLAPALLLGYHAWQAAKETIEPARCVRSRSVRSSWSRWRCTSPSSCRRHSPGLR